jgi:tetratricopeptide (TPR) repeat protein
MEKTQIKDLEYRVSYLNSGNERLAALLELSKAVSETDFVRSWILANEAAQEAENFDNKPALAQAHQQAASALWKLADYPQALEHYAQAMEIYELVQDYKGLSKVYCGIGIVHGELDENETSREYFEKGIEAAKLSGNENFSATQLGNIGFLYLHEYEYEKALKCFLAALEVHEIYNDNLNKANMLGGIAGAYVYLRKFNKGLEYLEKNLQLNQQLNNQHGVALALMNYGETHYQLGNYMGAIQYSEQALDIMEKMKLFSAKHKLHQILSRAYAALGDEATAHLHMKHYAEMETEAKLAEIQQKMKKYKQLKKIDALKKQSA